MPRIFHFRFGIHAQVWWVNETELIRNGDGGVVGGGDGGGNGGGDGGGGGWYISKYRNNDCLVIDIIKVSTNWRWAFHSFITAYLILISMFTVTCCNIAVIKWPQGNLSLTYIHTLKKYYYSSRNLMKYNFQHGNALGTQ